MSDHPVTVVELPAFETHPNADKLAIVTVCGYPVCVNKADWQPGQLAAYIPPDSVVPNTPEYSFLDGHLRIRAKKLRGVVSFGLLVPAPDGTKVGQDVADQLGITHYEPPLPLTSGGEDEHAPPGFVGSKYDIENLRAYPGLIPDGTPVVITEKIHGANARFTFREGRMWAGSRTAWKRESDCNLWWRALGRCPQIEKFCKANEGYTLYGEVFGQVQNLRYGTPNGVRFAAFDIAQKDGAFVNARKALMMLDEHAVPRVPLLYYDVFYSFDLCLGAAEGDSAVPGADHVREGCVVRPMLEMYSARVGRVIFKLHGAGFMLLKG